ncbi:hypothetical protein B0F90DRAFT_583446 [Multifurca ochricompacta]|nr:hypothetical protein B0F90DRAFT_583446 [Multifurca ochricompacta]
MIIPHVWVGPDEAIYLFGCMGSDLEHARTSPRRFYVVSRQRSVLRVSWGFYFENSRMQTLWRVVIVIPHVLYACGGMYILLPAIHGARDVNVARVSACPPPSPPVHAFAVSQERLSHWWKNSANHLATLLPNWASGSLINYRRDYTNRSLGLVGHGWCQMHLALYLKTWGGGACLPVCLSASR